MREGRCLAEAAVAYSSGREASRSKQITFGSGLAMWGLLCSPPPFVQNGCRMGKLKVCVSHS